MPFYLKWQFCLGPIAKYMHFREKPSVFYEFDDKYISFLHVLNLSFNYDQKTLGFGPVNRGVARKSCLFT